VVIRVNDAPREVLRASTVSSLLQDLRLIEQRGIAVAINGAVVPRSAWSGQELREADSVLVLTAMAGG
jgi:sulfur carrier protein